MKSAVNFIMILLASLCCCCHWCPSLSASATTTTELDEASITMANRLIQQIQQYETPPPSWNIMLQVLQSSFLNIKPNSDDTNNFSKDNNFHVSSPQEEKGRMDALHWLVHEDTVLSNNDNNLSEGEYDRGLLQRYALATIYFSMGGDDWNRCSQKKQQGDADATVIIADNDKDTTTTGSTSTCESDEERYLSPYSHYKWSGIKGKDGYVSWLDLSDQNLRSYSTFFLPLEITLLSPKLELLWISDNPKLSGTLPTYLGEFTSLVSLSVYNTSVAGSIPTTIYTSLSKLNSLRLYKSKFTGSISEDIQNLTGLKWLWLHGNSFTGSIPREIGKLINLEGVTLHGNNFEVVKDTNATIEEEKDGSGSLEVNILPEELCALRKIKMKHLWTDCEDGALIPSTIDGEDEEGLEYAVKEGVKACSCCTRCFPRNDNAENVVVAAA